MTVAARASEKLFGVQTPRVAPPRPAKTKAKDLKREAAEVGLKFIPAQDTAAAYLTATGPDGWLFREVAIIESRRNGKTELLVPRIRMDIRAGRAVLHTAQNRTLPRRVFMRVARSLPRNEVQSIRYANGQEQITMRNGGEYMIVAPQRGARGLGADTLIFDEIREFEDEDIMAAAAPTVASSSNGQIIYLSNAGSHRSVILNDLKRRGEAGDDPNLAYLEWSAGPEWAIDDRRGWAEANPALGHFLNIEALETAYRSLSPQRFETEHLCRWVDSMLPSVVSEAAWMQCATTITEKPVRPVIGISMHPSGSRASAVMAWQMTDGRIALRELLEATGAPIDTSELGPDIQALKMEHGAKRVAYASWTDKDIARHVRGAEQLDGKDFAAASEFFARAVMQGRIAFDADTGRHLTNDIKWSARKPHDSGSWVITPAEAERPVTAVLAAVRAAWWASQPRTQPRIG